MSTWQRLGRWALTLASDVKGSIRSPPPTIPRKEVIDMGKDQLAWGLAMILWYFKGWQREPRG